MGKFKTKDQRRTGIFSCNNYGHVARDCPFSWTLCRKLGHCRKQCIRNKSEPKIITFSVRDQESSTPKKYSKPAIFNDHRVTALLDTGYSICFPQRISSAKFGTKHFTG
ncbi:hypothetical protein NPIL_22751 [Nephila pilipes]|uniref:CCHC-type domain-containing protein n=1 Tax=Nephila pilipes TaxID=299642 RepID=A0A8X6I673_NEPPI|nr:hypothetical protein NPIL_22751 [Nephila pilipes]